MVSDIDFDLADVALQWRVVMIGSPFRQSKVAIVYDFDETLSKEAMQHYGVLPALNIAPGDFWRGVKDERKNNRSEELLVYMKRMIAIARERRVPLTRESFRAHGAGIKFFPGVDGWFSRMNEFVKSLPDAQGVELEHYIVSSGLKNMIEGCSIAKEFTEIFACEFDYNDSGEPEWPSRVISDSSKTQYLFRINKGILDVNESINQHMPEGDRAIPFDNMIYIGDGDTDVPSMAVTMKGGGHAVAVHSREKGNKKCASLKDAGRVDFYCEADYREGSQLDDLIKSTLRVIVSRIVLRQKIHALRSN